MATCPPSAALREFGTNGLADKLTCDLRALVLIFWTARKHEPKILVPEFERKSQMLFADD
jgi:hypothetical protein